MKHENGWNLRFCRKKENDNKNKKKNKQTNKNQQNNYKDRESDWSSYVNLEKQGKFIHLGMTKHKTDGDE